MTAPNRKQRVHPVYPVDPSVCEFMKELLRRLMSAGYSDIIAGVIIERSLGSVLGDHHRREGEVEFGIPRTSLADVMGDEAAFLSQRANAMKDVVAELTQSLQKYAAKDILPFGEKQWCKRKIEHARELEAQLEVMQDELARLLS